MEENTAIIGIILIAAISVTMFFVADQMNSGAAVINNYQVCDCKFVVGGQIYERQVQSNSPNCDVACYRYADNGQLIVQGEY